MPLDPTPPTEQRLQIPLDQLAPSPFNKRVISDTDPTLPALAESLKANQVQDIVVRPLREDTAQRAGDYADGRRYQIAAGHRRLAAAVLGGLPHLSAVVREISDEQMREIHAIENLQRENLRALEEAETFGLMATQDGLSYQQIADKIGRSKSFVAGRLKLLELEDTARNALAAGKIDAEVAVLISRVHPKLQSAALKRAMDRHPDGGQRSYRTIRDDLVDRFTLKLGEAIFDTQATDLVPHAGACTTCRKRTGVDPDLFDDVVNVGKDDRYYARKKGDNLCTDEVCWAEKKKAHLAIEAAKLEAKGKTVVNGNAARAALSADGQVKGAFVALADVKDAIAKVKAKDPEKVPEVVTILDQRSGKHFKAVRREDAKAAGVKLESTERAGPQRSWEEQQRQREEQRAKNEAAAKRENALRVALLRTVREAYAAAPRSAFDLQMVAMHVMRTLPWSTFDTLLALRGWKSRPAAEKAIAAETDVDALALFLLDAAVCTGLTVVDTGYIEPKRWEQPDALVATAKAYGIDMATARAAIAADTAQAAAKQLHSGDWVRVADGSRFEVLRSEVSPSGTPCVVVWAHNAEQVIALADIAEIIPKDQAAKKPAAKPTKKAAKAKTPAPAAPPAKSKRRTPAKGAGAGLLDQAAEVDDDGEGE